MATGLDKLFCLYYDDQPWVEWRHISIGKTHCDTCLKLDKCWFAKANMPRLPQHEYCHCTTVPKSILTVQKQATSVCAYEKFANYILDPLHPHNKGRAAMFETWGYTAADGNWLMNEYIRQAKQKYISGEYILGDLNSYGQRINILITLPRTDGSGVVTYKTGWIVEPRENQTGYTIWRKAIMKQTSTKLKEYDLVELTVDRDYYSKHGIYKGMQGIICCEKRIKGYALVEFSLYGEGGCIAVIDVRDEDLRVITEIDSWGNDRIKAEHDRASG